MLYYNEELVQWNRSDTNNLTEIEKEVKADIEKIKNTYFVANPNNALEFVWDAGAPTLAKNSKGQTVSIGRRIFPLCMKSADGMFIWTEKRLHKGTNGNLKGERRHIFQTTPFFIGLKEVELAYFMLKHCFNVLGGTWRLHDPDAEARKNNEKDKKDVDVKYLLFSEHSPLLEQKRFIEELAEAFEVDKVGVGDDRLRRMLYNKIKAGDSDPLIFANSERFMMFVKRQTDLTIASVIRMAIKEGVVIYDKASSYWKIVKVEHPLYKIMAKDYEGREALLMTEAIDNVRIRYRIYSAVGNENYTTIKELKSTPRSTLMGLAKEGEIAFEAKDTHEVLLNRIVKAHGLV